MQFEEEEKYCHNLFDCVTIKLLKDRKDTYWFTDGLLRQNVHPHAYLSNFHISNFEGFVRLGGRHELWNCAGNYLCGTGPLPKQTSTGQQQRRLLVQSIIGEQCAVKNVSQGNTNPLLFSSLGCGWGCKAAWRLSVTSCHTGLAISTWNESRQSQIMIRGS